MYEEREPFLLLSIDFGFQVLRDLHREILTPDTTRAVPADTLRGSFHVVMTQIRKRLRNWANENQPLIAKRCQIPFQNKPKSQEK